MSFQPAKDFLLTAAQKYGLRRQARGGLVCERVKQIFQQHYSEFADNWIPAKFEEGNLFIEVTDSAASSALFLRTMELGDMFERDEALREVQDVRIVRKSVTSVENE